MSDYFKIRHFTLKEYFDSNVCMKHLESVLLSRERLQNISPAEATTKEAVDKRRKRNGAEEAAITTR